MLICIIDKTYNNADDFRPYKWQIWKSGIGCLLRGESLTYDHVKDDAARAWEEFKTLEISFVDGSKF